MEVGESRTKSVVRRRCDVREITGKRKIKMEVVESRSKSVVRRPRCKRDNWKERKQNGSWGEQD
jgi:hypothetical protein